LENSIAQLETIRAIENNVALCQCIADIHKVPTILNSEVWMATRSMPPYYPNLITISPNADVDDCIDNLRQRLQPGWGVKDSFACLDLSANGFVIAVKGHWFVAPTEDILVENKFSQYRILTVQCRDEFNRWISAWDSVMDGKIFLPEILKIRNLKFVLVENEGDIIGGVLLNKSNSDVGMSNWFGKLLSVVEMISRNFGAKQQLVGYANESEIDQLGSIGFKINQEMRVWISK